MVPEKNFAYRASAGCLFVHMLITYQVKGTVLARAIHRYVAPSSSRDFASSRGTIVFMLVANGVLALTYLMANLIPFFDDLTAFLGAMQAPVLGFIVPMAFCLKAREASGTTTGQFEMVSLACVVLFVVLVRRLVPARPKR